MFIIKPIVAIIVPVFLRIILILLFLFLALILSVVQEKRMIAPQANIMIPNQKSDIT